MKVDMPLNKKTNRLITLASEWDPNLNKFLHSLFWPQCTSILSILLFFSILAWISFFHHCKGLLSGWFWSLRATPNDSMPPFVICKPCNVSCSALHMPWSCLPLYCVHKLPCFRCAHVTIRRTLEDFQAYATIRRAREAFQAYAMIQSIMESFHVFVTMWRAMEAFRAYVRIWRAIEAFHVFVTMWRAMEAFRAYVRIWRAIEAFHVFVTMWRAMEAFWAYVRIWRAIEAFHVFVTMWRAMEAYGGLLKHFMIL